MIEKAKANKVSSIVIATMLVVSAFAFSGTLRPVAALAVTCGQTITASVKLASDIGPCSGDGIIIGTDKITLDCDGHTVTGDDSFPSVGISLSSRTGVTVKNCHVTDFLDGFRLFSSSTNRLEGNTANGNDNGFNLGFSSNNNKVEGNTANGNNGDGFYLSGSNNNKVEGNTANNNGNDGFQLRSGSNNKLESNTANGNSNNLGFEVDSGSNNKLESNTANGNDNGFFFGPVSSNNKLKSNIADDNIGFGYIDLGTGTRTAGTANIYEDNECSSNTAGGSAPTGLCSPQT